jgi:hypothetical protein
MFILKKINKFMNTTQVYLQEEYAKTEIAKLLNRRRTSWSPVKARIH